MYNIGIGGYAEHVPGDAAHLEKIRKENAVNAERIHSLTIGFEVCAMTGLTKSTSGYPEIHPAVCPQEVAAMTHQLNCRKEKLLNELISREHSAVVYALHIR